MKDWERLNADRIQRVEAMAAWIVKNIVAHEDHCGSGCRLDLFGHDCCYTCNMMEKLLEQYDALSKRFGRGSAE